MCTCEEWKYCSNSWSITESIFAQGRAKGKLGGVCWRSLSINFIPSTQQEKGLIWVHLLDIGVTLTEFHEFWWLSISAGGYQKENQRRPTCHDYIEIKTERVKLYNLEDSRRQTLEAGAHLAGWPVGRPKGGSRPTPHVNQSGWVSWILPPPPLRMNNYRPFRSVWSEGCGSS